MSDLTVEAKAFVRFGIIYALLMLCYPKFLSAQRFLVFNNQKDISSNLRAGDSSYFAGNFRGSVLSYDKITAILYEEPVYLNQLQNQLAAADISAAFLTLKAMTDSGFYRFWILDKDKIYQKLATSTAFSAAHQRVTANFSRYLKNNKIRNPKLCREIMEMYHADQYYQWVGSFKTRYKTAYPEMSKKAVDSLTSNAFQHHTIKLKQIFKTHGYPWSNDIGKEATHYIWLMIQHADDDLPFQESYLKALKVAVEQQQASGLDLAYLTDRVRKNKKEKQIYGTQMEYKTIDDPVNGKTARMQPWPVEDPDGLDERRKAVGLMPMDQYLEMIRKLNNNQ
ncbi:DUF6624 domain-containing protein [Pedobacter caeni]|uniref:Uncharacterized protein n=1 Tax=Pedobacter caeni TaxID=288992 RepID=A0A1M4UZ43_9SPHI|nr:DUF6624 domain-containing protein [Pedobacter caeni]SHE61918.1 hypothetical protein SAMN04488522_101723 [Pedobacter caeni]